MKEGKKEKVKRKDNFEKMNTQKNMKQQKQKQKQKQEQEQKQK